SFPWVARRSGATLVVVEIIGGTSLVGCVEGQRDTTAQYLASPLSARPEFLWAQREALRTQLI
ncbi:MAG: hypothetical protein H0T71_02575, partial [Acidobacteria bacterium]|nr:hypothetical protein [Acidobacteriota bacterium]